MKYASLLTLSTCLCAALAHAGPAERYSVTGMILKIDRPNRTFVASCSAIPGFMDAMVMPYRAREPKALDGLEPGMLVNFALVVGQDDSYAENIRVRSFENLEQEPLRARRLQLISGLGKTNPPALAVGDPVPDFTLTDQTQRRVSLTQLRGKVVVVTFFYTSCPLPDYCFRLSNNFGRIKTRFAARMGRDLVLLSVTMDPAHDRPDVLAKYAETWKADPDSWHFLTGSLSGVKEVSRNFGVNFWPEEGTLTHSLHTVVIDRRGKLAANFEGNTFTAGQLGDFLETRLTPAD